jgi:hypothetical protein
MTNTTTSFLTSLLIHLFLVLSGTLFFKLNEKMTETETRQIIRLVSFSNINSNNIKSSIQSRVSKISSNNLRPQIMANNLNQVPSNNKTGETISNNSVSNSLPNNNGVDSSFGIKASEASAIEIEVNKIRIFLEKYLDQRINQRNISFKVEIKFYKNSNLLEVNLLSDKLSDRNISMIKQVISKYQKAELLKLISEDEFKVVIPITIS